MGNLNITRDVLTYFENLEMIDNAFFDFRSRDFGKEIFLILKHSKIAQMAKMFHKICPPQDFTRKSLHLSSLGEQATKSQILLGDP